jgi:hypothetical protein
MASPPSFREFAAPDPQHRRGASRRPHQTGGDAAWARRGTPGTLRTSSAEFDEVAADLERTLDFFKVPEEKAEVPAAFASHKDEVVAG